jgi:hypothetical protein
MVRGHDGRISYRELTLEEARAIIRDGARVEIVKFMNGQVKRAYQSDPTHSVENVLKERCLRAGMGAHFPLLPPEAQRALELSFSKKFDILVANAPGLLSAEQVAQTLEGLLDRYFEEAGKKLVEIDKMFKPEVSKGPLKTACLSTRDLIDFKLLEEASRLLGYMMHELAGASETDQQMMAMGFGRQLRDIFVRAGLSEVDSVAGFMEQARLLLETREGPKPFALAREISLSPSMIKLRDFLTKAAMDSHDARAAQAAGALLEVFKLFSTSSRSTPTPMPSPAPAPAKVGGPSAPPPPPSSSFFTIGPVPPSSSSKSLAPTPPAKMPAPAKAPAPPPPTGVTPTSTGTPPPPPPTPVTSSTVTSGGGGDPAPAPPPAKMAPPPPPPPTSPPQV